MAIDGKFASGPTGRRCMDRREERLVFHMCFHCKRTLRPRFGRSQLDTGRLRIFLAEIGEEEVSRIGFKLPWDLLP
jgi:hypothetical protein